MPVGNGKVKRAVITALEAGCSTAATVAQHANISTVQASSALKTLARMGLIRLSERKAKTAGRPGTWIWVNNP